MLRKRSSTEADREQGTRSSLFHDDKENSSSQEEMSGNRHVYTSQEEMLGNRHVYTRQEKRRSGGSLMSFLPPQSPMKRSEPMAVDHTEFQSPSAKRRSLHGPSSGSDFFSIFEQDSLSNAVHENQSQDDNDWLRTASTITSASRFSTVPKRASSLRKSTIQQRQAERASYNIKFSQPSDLGINLFSTTPMAKNDKPFRMSLDNEPLPRDSPFSAQGHLLNASIHPATAQHRAQHDLGTVTNRHPLSRTVTQSSSTTSIQDDSPTHEPFHRPARPKSYDFSRSLPPGALIPSASGDASEHSSQSSFATPGAYKSVKPLPAAFMSTGLISKKNRNIDDPNGGLPKAHMPDTPCKRQSIMLPAESKFGNIKGIAERNRESFGTPGTPADTRAVRPLSFAVRSAAYLEGRNTKPSLMRKMSFASIGSVDKMASQSPVRQQESQSTDSDFPPTPTKQFEDSTRDLSVSPSPRHSRGLSVPITAGHQFPSSKLSPIIQSPGYDEDRDSVIAGSPAAAIGLRRNMKKPAVPGPSYTHGRMLKNLTSPTPLARSALVLSSHNSPVLKRAKRDCVSPVTPHGDRYDGYSPRTPQESMFPPDPSGLTISGRGDRPHTRNGLTPVIPATPTGPREYFTNFSNRPSLDLNTARTATVDNNLISRFEKVELVGTGEFSQVYRVSKPPQSSPYHKIYVANGRSSSRSSMQERVWAVKKSRYSYTGPKDRQRKLNEVEVLKILGRSEHVVGFVDSWENDNHLYIQTEYCEEGTLAAFLSQMGAKARLDDFRIWKILLELSLGLKHIHESGFIHLDLKPANVLISFEGALKIADFGMATRWPAAAGIEGEGDREYIGPEVLRGEFDKPSDIFALGLMMLETAGNVELPDNGESWQKLRNGDMSDVPSLTFSSDTSIVTRDASGNPVEEDAALEGVDHDMDKDTDDTPGKALATIRIGELLEPPQFMIDANYEQSLDGVVRWMISPEPSHRPLASQVLEAEGLRFVDSRRRAGATVYEGNWGPADEILAEDAEMLDV